MDDKHLQALLQAAEAEKDGDWSVVSDERKISLHAAYAGAALNIAKVVRLKTDGELIQVETADGDLYVVALEDVYAGSVEGAKKSGRKAGFV